MKARIKFLKDNINTEIYEFIDDLRNNKNLTINEICKQTAKKYPILKLKTKQKILFYEALALMMAVTDKFEKMVLESRK